MRRRWIAVAVAGVLWLAAGSAHSDIAFPARLDVTEREPGVFDITFTLPIIEGRKLRAEPLMPPTCVEASPREAGLSAGGLTTTWSVRCEPTSLAGEAILVEGLLGTQTDLAFKLTMMDGRAYSTILRPSRPGFLVPEAPSPIALAQAAVIEGARRTLRYPGLWLLLAAVALLGARPRSLAVAAGIFAVGHFAAQWMGGRGWLEVAPQTRDVLIWASVAIPAIRLAGGGDGWKDWLRPLWPAALLLGLVFGAARPEALPTEGLSNAEQVMALVLFACGVGAAMLLIVAAVVELRAVVDLVGGGRWRETTMRVVGYTVGALATGMVLTRLVGWLMTTGNAPRAPLELMLLAAVLGPTLACISHQLSTATNDASYPGVISHLGVLNVLRSTPPRPKVRKPAWPRRLVALVTKPGEICRLALTGRGGGRTLLPFLAITAVGVAPGLLRVPLPAASLLVLGSLILLGGALALNRPMPNGWAMTVAALAVAAASWSTALALVENVSRATAVTMGVVLVAVFVFYAGLAMARDLRPGGLSLPVRLLGGVVASLAVVWRLAEYRAWFDREVATEAALGLARVPLLALGLAVLALILWPRRRRVVRELGLERDARGWHWVFLGAALLVVPYGTIAVANPFFEPHAPRGEDARRVVSRVLSDTYHAFNIGDEEELYDTLAANVTGALVDDLYLDGRRRLTAGTREGTKVTVRDVGVLEIGEPFGGASAEEGFSYDCSWAVVARVQHLQHVHHRQNVYNGVLTLRSIGGRWKIAGVELLSEDRVVVQWKPTS